MAFVRLSTEQEFLARMFMSNRRIMVSGGAGTGKTLLALHCARLLANDGKRVLLLCFNRALADHLHQTIQDAPTAAGHVEAVNFHRLCSQAGYALDQPFESLPKDITSNTDFWVNQAPKTLWEAIANQKIGPWDAIIVDEGQDFAPDWWEILECGITDHGHLAVFFDESQSLFEHGGELPDLGPIMPLDQNFRNTVAIANVLNQLVPSRTTSHPRCPAGESPTVIQQQGPSWTRRKLAEIIHNLVSVHGVKYHQMTILTPRTPANSVLEDTTDLDGIPIVHQVNLREEGVFHTSISGFKGLESDLVFMLDIDPEHERCSNRARYVGASRACHRLFVFEKGNWLD
jgi:superfamily I DNA/RNA helicase